MTTTSARRMTAMAALATVGGMIGALLVAAPAFAINFTVSNGASSGAGSFKQAIIDANGFAGPDQIVFDFAVPTTELNLTEALPTITATVQITGPGRDALTVNTAAGAPGLMVTGDAVQLTISGLTFETAAVGAEAGLFLDQANLVANDIRFRGYPSSGLLANDANVVVTDGFFTDNGGAGIDWNGDFTDAELEGLSLLRVDLTNNTYGADVTTVGSTGGITFAEVEASRNLFAGVQTVGTDFGPFLFDGGQYNENTNGIVLDFTSTSATELVTFQNGTQISDNDSTGLVADVDSTGGLHLRDAVITGNGLISPNVGGGIRFTGDSAGLLISGTTVSDNQATAGGGIYVGFLAGPAGLNIDDSVVENNTVSSPNPALGHGGGIFIGTIGGTLDTSGGLSLNDSSVAHNTAQRSGGGIYIDHLGNGVEFDGGLVLQETTIDDNHATEGDGGGIYVGEFSNAAFDDNAFIGFLRSTISRNTATNGFGGAFYFDKNGFSSENTSEILFVNSTVSGNDADLGGAGYLLGNVGVDDISFAIEISTFVNNSSGLFIDDGEIDVDVSNSIISKNGAVDLTLDDAMIPLLDVSYSNLYAPEATLLAAIQSGPGNQVGVDPKLGPLQNNGGTTETHIPLVGSPIWDAGDPAFGDFPDNDQRGEARIIVRLDMGSTETPRLLAATGSGLDPMLPLGAVLLLLAGAALIVTRRISARG